MKIGIKIFLIAFLILVLIVGITLACWQFRYLSFKNNVIGKTSAEVEELYGKFDGSGMPRGEDGLFRSCRCYYTVIEARVGFLGTEPPRIMVISFDQNAVAHEVSYEMGGWGG